MMTGKSRTGRSCAGENIFNTAFEKQLYKVSQKTSAITLG